MISRIAAGAILGLALTTAASAQSYNAPAGIPAVTAPGGLADDVGAVQRPTARDTRFGTLPAGADLTTGSVRRTHHTR